MNPYAQGMPDELIEGRTKSEVPSTNEEPVKKGGLTERSGRFIYFKCCLDWFS